MATIPTISTSNGEIISNTNIISHINAMIAQKLDSLRYGLHMPNSYHHIASILCGQRWCEKGD